MNSKINNIQTKNIICRCICSILSLLLLVGCGSKVVQKPQKIVSRETIKDEIPGEDAEYTTEKVYSYYDDQYTTTPGDWAAKSDSKMTVPNISNYYFDELDYMNVKYNGGTDVRTEKYLRGIGFTQYHATEGWVISDATRATDNANFKMLNVNSKRTWGESIRSGLSSDTFSYTGNLPNGGGLELAMFADGTRTAHNFAFSAPDALQTLKTSWFPFLENPLVRQSNKVILLGNEYRPLMSDSSGRWTLSGFEPVTQNNFKNNWLKKRFGTIEYLNKKCSTDFKSFNDVVPTEDNVILWNEFYMFQRDTFYNTMKQFVAAAKEKYPDSYWGYAGICSKNDPLGNNLYLDYLDYTTQNLYYNWWNRFDGFVFQLDNLTAWSDTAPVIITEIGFMNGNTAESKASAARKYKQTLNLFYMRPRVIGSYIFNYTCDGEDAIESDSTWGLVTTDRVKQPSFDAVAQVYTDFKYLDDIYLGASNTPLVAITNQSLDTETGKAVLTSDKIAAILYSKGVPIQVVSSDKSSSIDKLEEKTLIFNDVFMYQNPNGSGDVGTALVNYMNNGGKVLRTQSIIPEKLYGVGKDFSVSKMSELTQNYKNFIYKDIATSDTDKMWDVLGKLIHGDFVSGKVTVKKNTIDENAVRILDIDAYNTSNYADPSLDVNAQLVYKNGEMYLCVVNTGTTPIDNVEITFGVNNGVLCNLNPSLIRGDGNVSVYKPERANVPTWVDSSINSKVSYGTISVKTLDTYAYIHVGKAIIK